MMHNIIDLEANGLQQQMITSASIPVKNRNLMLQWAQLH